MTQSNPALKWLAEVQALQRQIGELQQERERAYESADNWRKLYDQEAQQRRRDAAIAAGKLERLQKDISDLRMADRAADVEADRSVNLEGDRPTDKNIAQSDSQSQQLRQLKAELEAAKQECQQLQTQVEAERAAHAQTRNSLTAALGDAVDLLSKERAAGNLEK